MTTRPKLECAGTEYVCLDKGDPPHELATAFAGLDAKGQAEFFSWLALASDRWEKPSCFQWAAMAAEMDPTAHRALRGMFDAANETV
jgi:hypothetical protein